MIAAVVVGRYRRGRVYLYSCEGAPWPNRMPYDRIILSNRDVITFTAQNFAEGGSRHKRSEELLIERHHPGSSDNLVVNKKRLKGGRTLYALIHREVLAAYHAALKPGAVLSLPMIYGNTFFRHEDGVYEEAGLSKSGEYRFRLFSEPAPGGRVLTSLNSREFWTLFPNPGELRARKILLRAAMAAAAGLYLIGLLLPWIPLKDELRREMLLRRQWEEKQQTVAREDERIAQYNADLSYLSALQNASPPSLYRLLSHLSDHTSSESGIEWAVMEGGCFRVQIWTGESEQLLAGLGTERAIRELESFEQGKTEEGSLKKLSLTGVVNE